MRSNVMKDKLRSVVWYLFLAIVIVGCVIFYFDVAKALSAGHYGKFESVCTVLGAALLFVFLWGKHNELSNFRRERAENYVFLFPKKESMMCTRESELGRLVKDYDLSDFEIDNIVVGSVFSAAIQYREDHPLK